MWAEMPVQALVVRALRESDSYRAKKPRSIPPADSPNRPALEFLFRYALWVRSRRPQAKRFTYEDVRYAIVWMGSRMCVMHVPSARVLVGSPGMRND